MKRKCRYSKSWQLAASSWQLKKLHAIFVLLLFLVACNEKPQPTTNNQQQTIYYCPMHPDVQLDHPGKCPKKECNGMDLVLKVDDAYLSSALLPVSSSVLSKIGLIKPVFKTLPVEVQSTGYIDYDNNFRSDISSRYSGRIEKLYVKYNFQPVKKGELLFEVYSPDLVNAQENLIYLLTHSPEEKELIAAAEQKLKLLQLTDEQIKTLEKSKKMNQTVPVYSKYDGFVYEFKADDMNDTKMDDHQKIQSLSVKEGMYVERGKVIFNVADPGHVVAMLKIRSADINKIHVGEEVNFYIGNDSSINKKGKITFIEPFFNTSAKSMMARVYFNNEQRVKIGSLVNAKIVADDMEALWLPASSVVDLGKSKIVFVWKDGSFKTVKVETGISSQGMTEIADGLTEADQVAKEAHFLMDSESFIKTDANE